MNNQKGQALLLAIVAIAAVLVVSLSVVTRSVTDVRTTANQEDSVRAFSAAESGVERALLTGQPVTLTNVEKATYSASVSNFAQGQTSIVHPRKPLSGDDVTIWMMSHDNSGNLSCSGLPCYAGPSVRVCWGSTTSTGTTPAVQVSVVYDPTSPYTVNSYGDIAVARVGYDSDPNRRSTNSFAVPDTGNCSISGTNFAYSANIDFNSLGIPSTSAGALKLVKIRPLYNINDAYPIGVVASAGQVFPGQGKQVESTGISGDATRKIRVYTLYPDLPFVFDSTVFSLGGIVQ